MDFIEKVRPSQTDFADLNSMLEEIYKVNERVLSEDRFEHVKRVVELSREMADEYMADSRVCIIAAALHDIAKQITMSENIYLVRLFGLDSKYEDNIALSHGKIAAEITKRIWKIDEENILNAISFHTTGRAGMSTEEKIVFLADSIEPCRKYPGIDEIRDVLEKEGLDSACISALEGIFKFVENADEDIEIDVDGYSAYRWLMAKQKGNFMNSKELALELAEKLEMKKAEEIVIIDVAEKSSMADYMILASGSNERMIGSLKDDIMEELEKLNVVVKSSEGKKESGWILIDCGDIIISLLTTEQRNRYNIEKVWAECEKLNREA